MVRLLLQDRMELAVVGLTRPSFRCGSSCAHHRGRLRFCSHRYRSMNEGDMVPREDQCPHSSRSLHQKSRLSDSRDIVGWSTNNIVRDPFIGTEQAAAISGRGSDLQTGVGLT